MWVEGARKVQALRERRKGIENIRKARGITLLWGWLSPEQQAQFDALRHFDINRLRHRHALSHTPWRSSKRTRD
jgi:hypothetical protein